MGLFVANDGHYQGWLAALLCCCAALDVDEHPIEKQRSRSSTQAGLVVCNEQPTPLTTLPMTTFAAYSEHSAPLTALPSRTTYPLRATSPPRLAKPFPVTRPVARDDGFIRPEDRVRPIAERPSSLKPLSFGEGSLLDRTRLSWQARQMNHAPDHIRRPRIGQPADFRQLDYSERQRNSLIPVKLAPVVLHRGTSSGAATFHRGSPTSIDDLMQAGGRNSRQKSGERASRHRLGPTSPTLAGPPHNSIPDRFHNMDPIRESRSTQSPIPSQSSSSSVNSPRRRGIETSCSSTPSHPRSEVVHSSASSVRSFLRHGTESSRPTTPVRPMPRLKRKRSNQSTRMSSSNNVGCDIDREILELNKIVEERRAEAAQSQGQNEKHVPAVAPLMAGRARSETLNAIGSAFSKPLLAGSLPVVMTNRLSRPFMSMPEPYTAQATSPATSKSGFRLSGWLSGLLSSPSANSSQEPGDKQTWLNHNRTESASSLFTSTTDFDVPSLTAASSPTSKGHSRSWTAESMMMTPSSTAYEYPKSDDNIALAGNEDWLVAVPRMSPAGQTA